MTPPTPATALREALEFIADWAHDCSPSNQATPFTRRHSDEIDPRAYGFDDIEERCRAALAVEPPAPTGPSWLIKVCPAAQCDEKHLHYYVVEGKR